MQKLQLIGLKERNWPRNECIGHVLALRSRWAKLAMAGCRFFFRLVLGFYIASLYCAVSAALMILLYRGPVKELRENGSVKFSLNRSEVLLTLTASLAWGFSTRAM